MSLLCLDWRASFSCCFSSLSCSFLHYVSELPCVFVMSFPTASTLRQLMFITEHSNKVNITVPRFSLHTGFFFNKSLLLLIISYSVHWPYIWQRHACCFVEVLISSLLPVNQNMEPMHELLAIVQSFYHWTILLRIFLLSAICLDYNCLIWGTSGDYINLSLSLQVLPSISLYLSVFSAWFTAAKAKHKGAVFSPRLGDRSI